MNSVLTLKPKTLPQRIVSGSIVLLSGSGLTSAINLGYNIVVARSLGPTGYGQATVVYTLLTLLSAVTLSFQIVATKVVAQQSTPEGKAAAYRGFHRSAWACGLLVGLVVFLFRGSISDYLNLPDPFLVALLAIGATFYVPLGSRRGYIQGTYGFHRLALNLALEGAVRLGGSYILILAGFGVRGVIAANAAAVAAAYFAIAPRLAVRIPNPLQFVYALRETFQALVFFSGQVLINNCDIVLVKHFFPPRTAGLYAAVAMVGRVIFAFSSAVVNTTFPLVAGTHDQERKDLTVIATSLLLVFGTGSVLALGLCITPAWVWTSFFGSGFAIAGKYSISYLLALYALTTVVYSLSVVIITYEMSYKIANTSWVQLAFSGVLIAGICFYHSSLREVILVQLVLMIVLFVSVALPFLINSLTDPINLPLAVTCRPVRLIRRMSEDEVISEFLKSDFCSPPFRDYYETLNTIVTAPNLEDAGENAKRRALLFIRHLALWKEIPADTEWYEVEVNEGEMDGIRVFPRAQWRKLARGNYSITEMAARMRTQRHTLDASFLSKIDAIGDQLLHEEAGYGAVILIGLGENKPLTVLDGNHRLMAAVLSSPRCLGKLKFVCGISPRMRECCWYNTNLGTLFRYGRNMMSHALRNPEAELARLLEQPEPLWPMAGERNASAPAAQTTTTIHEDGTMQRGPRQDMEMTLRTRAVAVKQLPATFNRKQEQMFLRELEGCLNVSRPCIVLDCSEARQMDRPCLHLLLCCLEEAMKRNGDVRLAAVRPEARAVLRDSRVDRLFKIFETNADAIDSFQQPSGYAACADGDHPQPAEHAA